MRGVMQLVRSAGLLLFSFEGRINRARFWLGWLGAVLLTVAVGQTMLLAIQVLAGPDTAEQAVLGARMLAAFVCGVLYFVMLFALLVERNHDRGRSGYWSLLLLIPLINIWAIIDLGAGEGEAGPNVYGPEPLTVRNPEKC
jgi:uncharacterized membrane protein YhaH (DUF805 family)